MRKSNRSRARQARCSHVGRHTTWAAVVDGDNVSRGHRLAPREVGALLAAARQHIGAQVAGGMPVTLAFQEHLADFYMVCFARFGWRNEFVSKGPDAADILLVEAAERHVGQGVTDLVVVSGDHRFAALAPYARLHVLAHRGSLSNELRMAATTVSYFDAPHTAHAA